MQRLFMTLVALAFTAAFAQEKTIDFWHIQSAGNGPMLVQQAVDRYLADNPDVNVEVVVNQNDPYKTRIRTAMGAGDTPCIYASWGGGPLYEYIQAGHALDLTPYLMTDDYVERFLPASLSNVTFDEKMYGIPVENTAVAVVWYNETIFERFDLTPPETWDELMDVAQTLLDNGIKPFALANRTKWTSSMYYMYLVDRLAGPGAFARAATRTGGSFNDPVFVQAGEMVQDLVRMGAFNDGFNGLDYDTGQSRMLMYGEVAAMELMGTWNLSTVQAENPDFFAQMDFFPFPAVTDGAGDPGNVVGTVGDNYYHIAPSCPHPDEAFELLTYLIDDESVAVRVENGRIPPVRGVSSQLENPLMQDIMAMVENASSVQLWYDQYLPPELGEVHKDTMQALFGLDITPEEAAARHEDAIVRFYSE